MTKEFYSNGKLLLSGEYVVLEGAVAFALPTKFGQSLSIVETETDCIHWVSYDVDGQVWMEEEVDLTDIAGDHTIINKSTYYTTLVQVLRAAHRQNPTVLIRGFEVTSKLTFPRLWGLGTSSTWINNIAQWLAINPYQLLNESFGGSGYDIACAQYPQGLFYTLTKSINPSIELVSFQPSFISSIYFVYLNQKKSSKEAIANFKANHNLLDESIGRISEISKELAVSKSLAKFTALVEEHEQIMSNVLGIQPIKKLLFEDFEGTIKSLGGWGGDFVMVLCETNPKEYFQSKGYETILSFEEMIL
ncbi:GYDIA family GHMP kinase [Myroides pelagicus]|uniref:GHMP kinase n=1 Tax=Myroides pelagicus TaxID=270914 RepID=A0A7K1GJ34_9FLAO|nr:GYDIA family GHMP kinase [Myroides pelagicus]MEC4112543.1 GYDIA family GHMP kinase [Myroides pelagicus]MTH28539.1 GHMP kinase [Myroides pelagicus]